LGVNDLNFERTKNILESNEILIERMKVETNKIEEQWIKLDSRNSQFPSIVDLFESKNNLKECNLFLEDYDKYYVTKRLM